MLAYSYSPETFELLNKFEVFIDPIQNTLMLPKFSTIAEPKKCGFGEVNVYNFSQKKWEIIKDYRGIWFNINNGNEVNIQTIFDVSNANPNNFKEILSQNIPYKYEFKVLTLSNGEKLVKENPHQHYTRLPFEFLEWDTTNMHFRVKEDMSKVKEKLIEKLKEVYEDFISSDIEFKNKEFQTDSNSLNLLQNKAIFMNDKESVEWITKDNSALTLNKNELIKVIQIINARNDKIFQAFQEIKNNIKQCANYADLEKIVSNWIEILAYKDIDEYTIKPIFHTFDERIKNG